jgi:hypothetical protein
VAGNPGKKNSSQQITEVAFFRLSIGSSKGYGCERDQKHFIALAGAARENTLDRESFSNALRRRSAALVAAVNVVCVCRYFEALQWHSAKRAFRLRSNNTNKIVKRCAHVRLCVVKKREKDSEAIPFG